MRRAAINLPARRIGNPIVDFLAALAFADALGDRPRAQPEPHVRVARSIPFTVADQGTRRKVATVVEKAAIRHRPPPDREWSGRAPVEAGKSYPMRRHRERLDDVFVAIPAVEIGPGDHGPIAIEPCLHQRIGADEVEPRDIARVTRQEGSVILHSGRDVDVAMARPIWESPGQHFHPRRRGIDVAPFQPLMARTSGIGGQGKLHRHPMNRPQTTMEAINRGRTFVVAGLFNGGVCQVLALVFLGVLVCFEWPEAQTATVLKLKGFFVFHPRRPEGAVDFLRAPDQIVLLWHFLAEKDGIESRSIPL